jgi:hypothetical protein
MTAQERDMLPEALGKVTVAGTYRGVDVAPGDILLAPGSPNGPTNMTSAQLAQLRLRATQGGIGAFFQQLFRIGTSYACGDTAVLHGTVTDVKPYQVYDYRLLGAIGEDYCDNIQAYYRQRLVDSRDSSDVSTYHDVDEITLRHEDWDTGGDGCGWVDDIGSSQGGGPCYGTIDPSDVRGPSPTVTVYIRGGAFHPKGYKDRWQTYGQKDTVWLPLYDQWYDPTTNLRTRHCSDAWMVYTSVSYSRYDPLSACDTWYS